MNKWSLVKTIVKYLQTVTELSLGLHTKMIMNKFSCTLHIPSCTAMVWLSALFPCRCIYIADACWKHKNETHVYTTLATCTEQCLATHLHIIQHLYRIMRHSHIPSYCIAGFLRGKIFTNQLPFVKILPLRCLY